MKCYYFFFILFFYHPDIIAQEKNCGCKPLINVKHQPRGEAKHITSFGGFPTKKDTIDIRYISNWQTKYADKTKSIKSSSSSRREKDSPEDSLYILKGYLWMVKLEKFDCDLHIEIGTVDSVDTRIIIEVPQENEQLREKIEYELAAQKLCIPNCNCKSTSISHFTHGVPVIVTGLGFYDGMHKHLLMHGDRHTKKYLWELHPVKDIIFL